MIIVINLFNQQFSHTAMAHISPIHHSAGQTQNSEELQRLAKGPALFGRSCQVCSICYSSWVQNALFSLSFLSPTNRELPPLCLIVWLLCRTLRLSSITDLTSPHRGGSNQTRCSFILQSDAHVSPEKKTHAHTLSVVWKFQGANLTRHTHLLTTRHMLTRCAHICMHCTARLSIALSFCLVLP